MPYRFKGLPGLGDGAPLDMSIQATDSLYAPGALPPGVSYLPGNIPGVPQGFTTPPLSASDVARFHQMGFVDDPNSAQDSPTYQPSLQSWYMGPDGQPVWLLSPQQIRSKNLTQSLANQGLYKPGGGGGVWIGTASTTSIPINSNGTQPTAQLPNPGAPPAVVPPSSGFSLSDVPWWGWLALAGAGFLVAKEL
jgi:hypothetical protein